MGDTDHKEFSYDDRTPQGIPSHSSADKATAEKLATDLRQNGVDVWYDEWEIQPGDSLRRKIDQGIEGASYFMLLLTPNSLRSAWVQRELDAGMVKRIEGSCRRIPIIYNLSDNQIPVTLKGLKWVKIDSYKDGLRELVNACHEIQTKPALGSPPARAEPKLPAELGLSTAAQRLAVLLAERSRTADVLDPQLDASTVLQELEITEDEASIAADELRERGWVRLHIHSNMGRAGFGRISPEPDLFFNEDPLVKGWDPTVDARTLAAVLVNSGQESVTMKEADQTLSWGPRRLKSSSQLSNFPVILPKAMCSKVAMIHTLFITFK